MDLFFREAADRIGDEDVLSKIDALLDWQVFSPIVTRGLERFGIGPQGYDPLVLFKCLRRQHEPQQIVGDLLNAEISEKQARSIKYQMTIAQLPLAKEIDEFSFEETPVKASVQIMMRSNLR